MACFTSRPPLAPKLFRFAQDDQRKSPRDDSAFRVIPFIAHLPRLVQHPASRIPAFTLPMTATPPAVDVLRLADIGFETHAALLAAHGLELVRVADGAPIPGSYWGDDEAGVIGRSVHARADTPVHSLLHEACHLLVLPPDRRAAVHTDATDSIEEEDATCYLQIVLADSLPGVGRERLMVDMDTWGYSFRLGSARAWFEHDAAEARALLVTRGLLPAAD